ncbi:MAG TPA: sensor domain-containing diguanylate cyclase [Pyrinomonadaceae bacterium]|nr:sensor domain-containing diguanylate cyclase [Pyrinomonadaceae bacterium]
MKESELYNSANDNQKFLSYSYLILAVVSLAAIAATFLAANSSLGFETKIAIFTWIVLLYPAFFFVVYLWQKRRAREVEREAAKNLFNSEIEGRLLALEEASEFFGASLKSADMFRLIASRIDELIPFAACALFLANEDNTRLKIALVAGENAQSLKNLEIDSHEGLAGKTFLSRQSQTDENLVFDKNVFESPEALKNLTSAVSAPVMRGADAFGALVLYGDKKKTFNQSSLKLLESVAERVAPLFSNSLAFERTVANSLTDALTNLPNERAFYLVLENQIAESQRFREERPLTILTVDIKNFAELNDKFGHSTGDRILTFAAAVIKEQLRQMDFLARSTGDEFLAVLPTASNKTAAEIVGRVEEAFAAKPFEISRQKKTYLLLNFGIATFLKDGETAGQLLQTAYLRKQQSKAPGKSSVLPFPKEFVN